MNKILLSCVTLISLFTMTACNKINEFSGSSGGYNQEVFSIVSSRCYECHANGNSEGGFGYIDDVDLMVESGLITPSAPAESRMYKKIMGTTSGQKMPWGGPYLNKQQSDAVLAWIGSVGTTTDTSGDSGECIVPTTLPGTATWTQVKTILNTKCVGCHQINESAETNWLMDGDGDDIADFTQMKISNSVNCSISGACSPFDGAMVVDSNPCSSRLYRRVSNSVLMTDIPHDMGEMAWRKMPPAGPYLSDSEKALIYQWIQLGAQDN